jgi:hypothetical protein
MFDRFERIIRRTLRKLAKPRVRMVLLPGNYWVVERAIDLDDDTRAALLTCQMRGWIEPLLHAVPSWQATPSGALPPNFNLKKAEPATVSSQPAGPSSTALI